MSDWTNSILTGDCFDVLEQMPAESVHAIVTDPPYGLAFMGRDWDDFEPREYQEWCEQWASGAQRVLKPGGHLLAFSGNRTHHRLFSGVQDAGYEVRDTLTWHYGSGFPKASDVSKTIDKRADAEREDLGPNPNAVGRSYNKTGGDYNDDHKEDRAKQDRITAPATDAARKWDGWRTGLKPATEFVCLARKPFDGATADCVLEHGTGALNIDGARIDSEERPNREPSDAETGTKDKYGEYQYDTSRANGTTTEGRYPSNVVFDKQAAERLDREVGDLSGGARTPQTQTGRNTSDAPTHNDPDGRIQLEGGGPSRYFYTSKATKSERTLDGRIENDHPTVKPQDLMEWLVKLATAEGQTVLDPFVGSGTTCAAAKDLGRQFIGIEKQSRWADVARVRVGLTPDDPSRVRDDDTQQGLEAFTDGGGGDD